MIRRKLAPAISAALQNYDESVNERRTASRRTEQWFEIPASYVSNEGTVLIKAPAGTNVLKLAESFRDGVYPKPFVVDDGLQRRLHFDLRYVQSAINLKDPDQLVFAYTQAMMAFLLFQTNPKHVVVVGLGGGSLTKFCYQRLPRAHITTIEIDADVIALSELFQMPAPSARMPILHADAVDYFERTEDMADVVLVDGCDKLGIAPAFCEPAFYRKLHARLQPGGMLVVNLIGDEERSLEIQRIVDQTFGGHCMSLAVKGGNRVLFAFNDSAAKPDWAALKGRAERLEDETGLEYRSYLRRLKRSFKRGTVDYG